jgi:hypothetical protein
VKEFFPYNGNDALEAQIAFGVADVFGTIGQDPGIAWQSNGVTTSDRNLSILDDLATASAGFTQPHLRFANTAVGTDLSGFGLSPVANDPFKSWLQSFGLSDAHDDSDIDSISNLLEYATGSNPISAASAFPPTIETDSFKFRQLDSPGRLLYTIETSPDLDQWIPANLVLTSSTPNGDGTSTLTYSLPLASPRSFLRLRVTLE